MFMPHDLSWQRLLETVKREFQDSRSDIYIQKFMRPNSELLQVLQTNLLSKKRSQIIALSIGG